MMCNLNQSDNIWQNPQPKEKLFRANLTYYTKKITLNSLFEALEGKKVDAKVAGGCNK